MTITDTCKCGAQFEVSCWTAQNAHEVWVAWHRLHLPCRGLVEKKELTL